MNIRIAALVLSLAYSMAAHAGPREDALAAFDRFFATFTPSNQQAMASLFAPDVQFYGTNSPEVVTSKEGIVAYFTRALSTERGTVMARPFDRTALVISDTLVAVAGKWQSERTLDGKMSTAGPSRVTALMHKRGDQWLIVQFHNSPVPAAPAGSR